MPILVGFTGTPAGRDALAFAATLARTINSHLEVVMILPERNDPNDVLTDHQAYSDLVDEQARTWLTDAEDQVSDVKIETHIRYAESPVEGILAACEEFQPIFLVMGAGRHGALGRVSLGTVGQTLMHSAPVPIGVAPRGSRHNRIRTFSRITVGIGDRSGTPRLLKAAATLANRAEVGVRLISIQERKKDSPSDEELRAIGQKSAQEAAEKMRELIGPKLPVETSVVVGDNITEATEDTQWLPDEIAMLGSSKLAAPRRLFLGSVANKVLRVLPVPLVVIPSE